MRQTLRRARRGDESKDKLLTEAVDMLLGDDCKRGWADEGHTRQIRANTRAWREAAKAIDVVEDGD